MSILNAFNIFLCLISCASWNPLVGSVMLSSCNNRELSKYMRHIDEYPRNLVKLSSKWWTNIVWLLRTPRNRWQLLRQCTNIRMLASEYLQHLMLSAQVKNEETKNKLENHIIFLVMNVYIFLKACREIFQSEKTATKEQRQSVERACNDNNTNLKVLNCVGEIMDVTPIENSKQC